MFSCVLFMTTAAPSKEKPEWLFATGLLQSGRCAPEKGEGALSSTPAWLNEEEVAALFSAPALEGQPRVLITAALLLGWIPSWSFGGAPPALCPAESPARGLGLQGASVGTRMGQARLVSHWFPNQSLLEPEAGFLEARRLMK